MSTYEPTPAIKRIGLAVELEDGQIIQVYSDTPGGAWMEIERETETLNAWDHGIPVRYILGTRTNIHINDLGSHLIHHYRPGTNYEELEAPTRAITPPPAAKEATP